MTITNGYCTLDDVRADLNIPFSSTDKDARVEAAINAASRQIDAHCGRRFWQDASVVERTYQADSVLSVLVDDISTTTGLIVKIDDDDDGVFETTLTISSEFVLFPLNADKRNPVWPFDEVRIVGNSTTGLPIYASGRPGVQVTARFGWPAVPDDVARACAIQAVQVYKAADAAFGAVQIGIDGQVQRLGTTINPIAAALLETYCKPRIG